MSAGAQTSSPQVPYGEAARFLEQATFGPTASDIANLQQLGIAGWLAQEEQTAPTLIAEPSASQTKINDTYVQAAFMHDIVSGPDQLRQRMSFTLSQIFVVSGLELNVSALLEYVNLLQNDAFANYRTIMQDVTLSPSMGRYLDMVDNRKPGNGTLPNENYARELMQLFTIGTVELNSDGSNVLDSNGNPIPLYGETDIQNLARVFTGWTYPTEPGAQAKNANPPYFIGPMIAVESAHDTGSKTFLGQTLPAGQTAEQDLSQTLDIIFNHPNLPPFVSLRLIQHLVTSNPSPAFIGRIASVFQDDGTGVRGNMVAVISAILNDPEARQGDNPANAIVTGGHLREPVLYLSAILRALGATVPANTNLYNDCALLGENPLEAPSVFNYYSPFYSVDNGALFAPEFQLLTPATAVQRANVVDAMLPHVTGPTVTIGGITVDLTRFINDAGNTATLLNDVNQTFMRGQMTSQLNSAIESVLDAVKSPNLRAKTAIYLAVTAAEYQVEQ